MGALTFGERGAMYTGYDDAGSRLKEELAAENFEYRKQVQNTLAQIAKELRGLRAQAALGGQGPVRGGELGAPAKAKARNAPTGGRRPSAGGKPEAGEEPAEAADGGPLRALPGGKPA